MFLSEWREFPSAPCLAGEKKNFMTARVSILLKSRASLTFFIACFLPGRANDLSAPRYIHIYIIWTVLKISGQISGLNSLHQSKEKKSYQPTSANTEFSRRSPQNLLIPLLCLWKNINPIVSSIPIQNEQTLADVFIHACQTIRNSLGTFGRPTVQCVHVYIDYRGEYFERLLCTVRR